MPKAKTRLERVILDEVGRIRPGITMKDLVVTGVLGKDLSSRSFAVGVKLPIQLTLDSNVCETACTNGSRKLINANMQIGGRCQIHQAVSIVRAANLHEDGHILYTNFVEYSRLGESLQKGKLLFPNASYSAKERDNLEDIAEFIGSNNEDEGEIIAGLFHHVMNVIEDAHIEPRLLKLAPGWANTSLGLLRQMQASDAPYVDDLIEAIDEKETSLPEAWMGLFLYYAKYGILNYEQAEVFDHDLVRLLMGIDSIMDDAIYDMNFSVRAENAWRIFVRVWMEVFKPLAKNQKLRKAFEKKLSQMFGSPNETSGNTTGEQKSGKCGANGKSAAARQAVRVAVSAATSGDDDSDDDNSNSPSPTSGGTDDSNAETEDTDNGSQGNTPAPEEDEDAKSPNPSGTGKSEESDEGEKGQSAQKSNTEESASSLEDDSSGSANSAKKQTRRQDSEFNQNSTMKGSADKTPVANIETGRIKDSAGVATEAASSNSVDNEVSEVEGGNDDLADIEQLLKSAAEAIAIQQAENALCRSLEAEARALPYTPIHKNCSTPVRRVAHVSDNMVVAYDAIRNNPAVTSAINTLARQFERLFKSPGFSRTSLSGTRLNTRKYKNEEINGRIFYRKAPNTPKVVIGVVIDESGSMSSNNRAYHARIFAIIIQAVCEKMGIPVVIYGHYSEGSDCTLYAYTEFDSVDGNDKYRLTDITARNGGNRDGAAVYYVASRLAKRPEPIKLLFSMSDGQPASNGYQGEEAEKDIRSIVQHFRRKGIVTFGAAIGSDKDRIRRCYGEGFLDVTDISALPTMIHNIVKAKIKN